MAISTLPSTVEEKTVERAANGSAFIPPLDVDDNDIKKKKKHYKLPTRCGAIPVDEAPMGWEVETQPRRTRVTKFQHAYPRITLPFQELQRPEFGHGAKF